MTRINIYSRNGFGDDRLIGWFNPDRAERVWSNTYWDGGNNICVHTRSLGRWQTLYRTAGGRYVLAHMTNWSDEQDEYEFISADEAREWLIADGNDEKVNEWFGPLDEEADPAPAPPKAGRPAIGPEIPVAYPRELLDRIEAAAKADGISRAAWLRQAAEQALNAGD